MSSYAETNGSNYFNYSTYSDYSADSLMPNVVVRMSPVSSPRFSHFMRWALVPWVNDSGCTYPRAFFCR